MEIDEIIRSLAIPLPFSFQDGAIEHICSSDEDTTKSLNIKKAILSSIINTMERLDQSQEVFEVISEILFFLFECFDLIDKVH